jgi:hypothetical protein
MSQFLFMGEQEDPEMDTHVARGTVRVYDGRPPPDEYLHCLHCRERLPHRFQPSPDAGPFWRCSGCGAIHGDPKP